MTPQKLIKEQKNNIATIIYADKIKNPIKILELEALLKSVIISLIDQEIERLEKEIEHIQKHSKGNYADGKVEAFTETMVHLTSLKELIK